MTIRSRPQSLPTELPPARLYLDDLTELIQILAEDYSDPQVTFTVGNHVCDTLKDLKQLGRRATDFQIEVRAAQYNSSGVRLSRHGTSFFIYGNRSEGWSKYSRVLAVFQKRRLTLKWLLGSSISSFLSGALTTLVVTGLPIAIVAKSLRWSSLCVLLGLMTLVLHRYFLGWHSVVEFRNSYEVGVGRWLEEQKTPIIMVVISSLIAAIITEAIRRAFH
jgi:hypothetical protein